MQKPEHTALIQIIAAKYAKMGLDYDDIVSEGNLAYVNAVNTHDPSRGPFKTHLRTCIENSAKNYIANVNYQKREMPRVSIKEDMSSGQSPDPLSTLIFKEVIENLSDEAREVVDIVLDCPSDLVAIMKQKQSGACRINKTGLVPLLRSRGWGFNTIGQVFNELKTAF